MPRVCKSKVDLFRMLPPELLNGIVDSVRRDDAGNETIPGHVAGAQLRGASKFLQEASDALESELDGDWTVQEFQHGFFNDTNFTAINSFRGGKRFTPLPTNGTETDQMQLHLVRKPSTGALKAFMSRPSGHADNPTDHAHSATKPREYILSLKGLTQVLSGHNAEFDTRLMHIDEVNSGKEVRVKGEDINKTLEHQSVNAWLLVSNEYQGIAPFTGRVINEDVMIGYKVVMVPNQMGTQAWKHVITPTITLMPSRASSPRRTANIPLNLDDGRPGEPVNVHRTAVERAKKLTVSPLTIVAGYHDAPLVAECRHAREYESEPARWLTSLYRIPASVVQEKPTRANPSAGLRTRATCAILSVDQAIEITPRDASGQIVVRRCPTPAEEAEHERRVSLYKRGGPAAAVARPRASAEDARAKMKPQIAELKGTYNSGRLEARMQPWESKQGEEDGDWVDEQYATILAEGESMNDDDTDDCDYMPKAKMKKIEPTPAPNVSALRRFVVISDDEDDEAPAPPMTFRENAMRVLDAVFDSDDD